jgi:tetratricopeptide (TPR) repeat protein
MTRKFIIRTATAILLYAALGISCLWIAQHYAETLVVSTALAAVLADDSLRKDAAIEQAALNSVDSMLAHRLVARNALKNRNYQQARAHLETAMAIRPSDANVLRELLATTWYQGDVFTLSRLWLQVGTEGTNRSRVAYKLLANGDYWLATPWLDRIVETESPVDPSVLFQLALSSAYTGQGDRAYARIRSLRDDSSSKVINILPSSPQNVLRVAGGELWTIHNQKAAFADNPSIGVMWSTYLAGLALYIPTSSVVEVRLSLKHSGPETIDYQLVVDGQNTDQFTLVARDWSWETRKTQVVLSPGLHIIGVAPVRTSDAHQAGFVEWIEVARK